MAVYICKCGFSFERSGAAEQCPDCGGMNIRYASDAEMEAYQRGRAGETRASDPEKAGKSFERV